MELKVAAMQHKINRLVDNQEKMKNDYEKTINELNEKLLELQMKLDELTSSDSSKQPSPPGHNSTGLFSWFRKSDSKHPT